MTKTKIKSKEKDEFYQELDKLKLETTDKSLNKKKDSFKKEVFSFIENIKKLKIDEKIKKRNENIFSILEGNLDTIKAVCLAWEEDFQVKLKEEEFREFLENSFVVIIYGKVKAGKSSLGNFIASNAPKKDIEFFTYDEAGERTSIDKLSEIREKDTEKEETFKTDNLECTSTIQGFKYSSLAWIDTPGLFSNKEENGQLAQRYINAADFIIFPLSSEAPQEMGNIAEIKKLIKEAKKKVTVLITKSDTPDFDVCECGVSCNNCDDGVITVFVNKDEERRRKQEEGVLKELTEIENMLEGDIFSMSAFTAKTALKNNNEELYRKSNMDKFYSMFTETIKTKANSFKTEAPLANFKAFMNKVISSDDNSLKTIENSVISLKESLEAKKDEINKFQGESLYFARNSIESFISAEDINKDNAQTKFKELDEKISEAVKQNIGENLQKVFDSFETSFQDFKNELGQNFEIKDKTREISYSKKSRSTIGAVVETVTFGLVNMTKNSDYSRTVIIGDNSFEVIKAFKEAQIKTMEAFINKTFNDIKDEVLKETDKFLNAVTLNIENLKAAVSRIENVK